MAVPIDPTLTFVLALIGTVTGATTAGVEIVRTIRDRARVKLLLTSHSSIESPNPWLSIDVINTGRQPLTIREVGLYPGSVRIRHKSQEDGAERDGECEVLLSFTSEPFVLEAGSLATFHGHLDEFFNVGLHADRPARPFAIDLRRHWHWGDSEPVMRSLIEQGYRVPAETPDHLLDTTAEPQAQPPKPRKGLRGSRRKGERVIARLESGLVVDP
jgi:hypothetical protein